MAEAGLENLNGNRTYNSDKLDRELRQDGIEMIVLHNRIQVRIEHMMVATSDVTNGAG